MSGSPPQAAAPMAVGLAGNVDRARTELGAMLRAVPGLPAAVGAAVARFSEGRAPYHLLLVAALFAVMLAFGFLAERLARWLHGLDGRVGPGRLSPGPIDFPVGRGRRRV